MVQGRKIRGKATKQISAIGDWVGESMSVVYCTGYPDTFEKCMIRSSSPV